MHALNSTNLAPSNCHFFRYLQNITILLSDYLQMFVGLAPPLRHFGFYKGQHFTQQNIYRFCQIFFFFFGKCFKKTTEHFLKFDFYLKVQSFHLVTENNFIQMAASAGHAVAYRIGTIFKHIIDCVLYFGICLWLVGVTLPTNNIPTVSNRSPKVAKQDQLCG